MIDLSTALKNSPPLRVHAHWDPIADATYNLHKEPENLELFDLSPNEPTKEYKGQAFNAFLSSASVAVGDVWELDLDAVIPFLSQFHPGATGKLRHGQKGAFACLRALSADYTDITFRIHAEFTLATRPKPGLKPDGDEDHVQRARLLELVEDPDEDSVSVFAKTLREHYVGAVDIQVLNPEGEIIMHQPENQLPSRNPAQKYLTQLADVAKGEIGSLFSGTGGDPIGTSENEEKLMPKSDLGSPQEMMEVLNVFRGPGDGYQDYTTVEIDTISFEQDGTLIIDIQVGEGEATGSFDLFAGDAELPTEGFPDDALASAWDIPPSDTGQIRHQFTRGQRFKLGATGNWFCEKGSTNAFLARISVIPAETREAEASS